MCQKFEAQLFIIETKQKEHLLQSGVSFLVDTNHSTVYINAVASFDGDFHFSGGKNRFFGGPALLQVAPRVHLRGWGHKQLIGFLPLVML